jgi:RES domain-containing protein
MLDEKGIRAYLPRVAHRREGGPFFRRLKLEPLKLFIEQGRLDLLYALGAGMVGGRFTPKGSNMKCLYVSEDELTAKAECYRLRNLSRGQLERAPASPPGVSYSVTANLERILDLTNRSHLNHLETTVEELSLEFRGAPPTVIIPSQVLGQLAYESGLFDGIRYFSAIRPDHANYVIWRDRLAKDAEVTEI